MAMDQLYLLNNRAPAQPDEWLTEEQVVVIDTEGTPGSGYCQALTREPYLTTGWVVTDPAKRWRPCNGKTVGARAGYRVCGSHFVSETIKVPA